jgi:hypothetical protein
MKRVSIILVFTLLVTLGFSQENAVTLSGGYAFATIEDTDVKTTGWRINALYEYNPAGGNWAHGLSFGYVNLSGESKGSSQTTQYDISSWPMYYAPKYLFGGESFKGFVKGAIGWQISSLERSGPLASISDNDTGLLGGGGVGAQYLLNEKIFLSAEYELLWMSNTFYKDGWLNTASLGIGIRF